MGNRKKNIIIVVFILITLKITLKSQTLLNVIVEDTKPCTNELVEFLLRNSNIKKNQNQQGYTLTVGTSLCDNETIMLHYKFTTDGGDLMKFSSLPAEGKIEIKKGINQLKECIDEKFSTKVGDFTPTLCNCKIDNIKKWATLTVEWQEAFNSSLGKGKEKKNEPSEAEMSKQNAFSFEDCNLINLDGLKYFKYPDRIEGLSLKKNKLQTLDGIENLPNLNYINLQDNKKLYNVNSLLNFNFTAGKKLRILIAGTAISADDIEKLKLKYDVH